MIILKEKYRRAPGKRAPVQPSRKFQRGVTIAASVDAIDVRSMRFNVAPDVMPIVGTSRDDAVTIKELRQGLVPYWAKGMKKLRREVASRSSISSATQHAWK